MHHAFWLAGLLGLVAFAFGAPAAAILARILVLSGLAALLWVAFMVITERL